MKNVMRVTALVCVVAMALVMTGCPNRNLNNATELTIGGAPITAVLQAGDSHWYKVVIDVDADAPKTYDFVLAANAADAAVGAVGTIYWMDEENDQLLQMFRGAAAPAPYIPLTYEVAEIDKQMPAPGFLPPYTGDYYIEVAGYEQSAGRQQRNSYAYLDTLVYNISVKMSANVDEEGLRRDVVAATALQAANVPYLTGIVGPGETFYHPVTLKKDTAYQMQAWAKGSVNIALVDKFENVKVTGANAYFTVVADADYFVRVRSTGNAFAYVAYGVRVMVDDHPADPRTTIAIGDKAAGYLGDGDVDYFVIVNSTDAAVTVEIKVDNADVEVWGAAGPDADGVYTATVAPKVGDDDGTLNISVSTDVEYGTDGLGAYEVSVSKKADPAV